MPRNSAASVHSYVGGVRYQFEYLWVLPMRLASDEPWRPDGMSGRNSGISAATWDEVLDRLTSGDGYPHSDGFVARVIDTELNEVAGVYYHARCTTRLPTEIEYEGYPMPAVPAATPASAHPSTPGAAECMAKVAIRRDPTNARLFLHVDAKNLHDMLDALGVAHAGTMYEGRPASRAAVAGTDYQLSTEVFLNRTYPAKYDLSSVFSSPPSLNNLKRLCNSAFEAVRKILEHYQPIDISVEIQKKAVG